jgi:hypothetical protein
MRKTRKQQFHDNPKYTAGQINNGELRRRMSVKCNVLSRVADEGGKKIIHEVLGALDETLAELRDEASASPAAPATGRTP